MPLLKYFLLFVGLISLNIPNIESSFVRIYGGNIADEGQFPYQISLRVKSNNKHFCGGSIISSWWVLTAAHCAYPAYIQQFVIKLKIVVGSNSLEEDGTSYDIEKYKVHERYTSRVTKNDVAVIKSKTAIQFSDTVQPIVLASKNVPDGSKVVVSGWGFTKLIDPVIPTYLQFVYLKTIPLDECKRSFVKQQVSDDSICTYTQINEGTCKGDSGGPLTDVNSGLQIGVVSWGIPCAVGSPDVYASVAFHRSWIYEKTGI